MSEEKSGDSRMKKMNRLILSVIAGFAVLLGLVNIYLSKVSFTGGDRQYRVSVNRVDQALGRFEAENGRAPAVLQELSRFTGEEYPCITGLYAADAASRQEELADFLKDEAEDYVILSTENYYYRLTYRSDSTVNKPVALLINGSALLMLAGILTVLFYVREKILRPFYELSEVPYELSKGNLTVPLKENEGRFFGRFVWGMDLLREKLEENKRCELNLQKEKKLLLLSLSHDIKTPLSAIKLYAKALSRNLYKDEVKKQEITERISEKADEIEGYISDIVRASHEDFLSFDVSNGEFYIQEPIEQIRKYYEEKMALNQIRFCIEKYSNCLVRGDSDRFVEVLQNIIENAVKYGDGRTIWVDFSQEEESYAVTISNTGCGLSDKELPHIFDSFFRGSNADRRPGSGLGLYICRQLMHLMEGEIIASIRENGQTRIMAVSVTLQLA